MRLCLQSACSHFEPKSGRMDSILGFSVYCRVYFGTIARLERGLKHASIIGKLVNST